MGLQPAGRTLEPGALGHTGRYAVCLRERHHVRVAEGRNRPGIQIEKPYALRQWRGPGDHGATGKKKAGEHTRPLNRITESQNTIVIHQWKVPTDGAILGTSPGPPIDLCQSINSCAGNKLFKNPTVFSFINRLDADQHSKRSARLVSQHQLNDSE